MLTLQSIGWNEFKNKEKKKKVNDTGYDVRSSIPVTTPPPPISTLLQREVHKGHDSFPHLTMTALQKILLWSAMGNQYKKGEISSMHSIEKIIEKSQTKETFA